MGSLDQSTLGLVLYDYQKAWITDDSRFKVGMMARQCGKTFTTTLEIVLDCLAAEAAGRKARWVILSRGERQAREAMEEGIKKHLAAVKIMVQVSEGEWEPGIKALEVTLPGGSRITALPANPDTARGFSANVLLDEFAFHQDSRKIWQALFPVISAGHKLRVISTPNGKGNKFYDLITTEESSWSKHMTDIHQAVAAGLPRNIDELRRGVGDSDAWAQEYELEWLDEASAWLPFDLINSAEADGSGNPALYGGRPCFVGVDIGTRRDLFVIWVLEQVGDVLWTREIVALKRASFAEQDMALARVFKQYNVVRCCMDQTGMGEKPVEDAKRAHGQIRVEGVIFTSPAKLMLATEGKEAFEDRRIRIPLGDADVRADLHKIKRETTSLGNARFVADSDAAGHADRAWACFLAVHAAGKRSAVMDEVTLPRAGEGTRWHLGNGYQNESEDDDVDSDERYIWQTM